MVGGKSAHCGCMYTYVRMYIYTYVHMYVNTWPRFTQDTLSVLLLTCFFHLSNTLVDIRPLLMSEAIHAEIRFVSE